MGHLAISWLQLCVLQNYLRRRGWRTEKKENFSQTIVVFKTLTWVVKFGEIEIPLGVRWAFESFKGFEWRSNAAVLFLHDD
jgi:hypothetical protein